MATPDSQSSAGQPANNSPPPLTGSRGSVRGEKDYRPRHPDLTPQGSAGPANNSNNNRSNSHHRRPKSSARPRTVNFYSFFPLGLAVLIILVILGGAYLYLSRHVQSRVISGTSPSEVASPGAVTTLNSPKASSPSENHPRPAQVSSFPSSPSPSRSQIITAVSPLLTERQLKLTALSVENCQPVVNVFATSGGKATCAIEFKVVYPDGKTAVSSATVDFIMDSHSAWHALPAHH